MEFYSTDEVPSSRRLSYWSDVISRTFTGLEVRPADDGGYEARLARAAVGNLSIANPMSAAAQLLHTKQHVARADERCLLVHYQVSGASRFTQLHRSAQIEAGDFVLADTTRPYEFRLSPDNRMLVVRVPEKCFSAWHVPIDSVFGIAIPGNLPTSMLLASCMRTLWNDILVRPEPGIPPHQLEKVMIDLIEIACAPYVPRAAPKSRRDLSRDKILEYIGRHLYNPELSVGFIAAALELTPRYIQKLFTEINTTPAKYIWYQRLRSAAHRLEDPADRQRSLSEIAFSVGFNDLSHFGRLFKGTFGVTPTAYRRSIVDASANTAHPQ